MLDGDEIQWDNMDEKDRLAAACLSVSLSLSYLVPWQIYMVLVSGGMMGLAIGVPKVKKQGEG